MTDGQFPRGLKAVTNSQVVGNGTEITIYGETAMTPGDCIRLVMGQTKSKVLQIEESAGADYYVRIGDDEQSLGAAGNGRRLRLRFISDGMNSSGDSFNFFRVSLE